MNYKELQKATDLLKKITEIEFYLKTTKTSLSNIEIRVHTHVIFFNNEYKQKFDDTLKRIKNELVEELNKLGVVEDK